MVFIFIFLAKNLEGGGIFVSLCKRITINQLKNIYYEKSIFAFGPCMYDCSLQ